MVLCRCISRFPSVPSVSEVLIVVLDLMSACQDDNTRGNCVDILRVLDVEVNHVGRRLVVKELKLMHGFSC